MHMGVHEKILPMTPEEIKREYLEAKDGAQQIRILADENLCSVSKIKTVLEAQGVELPKKRAYTKKPPRVPFTLDAPTPKERKANFALNEDEKTLLEGLLQIAAEATKEEITKKIEELGGLKRALQDIGKLAMRFEVEVDLNIKEGKDETDRHD